MGVSSGCDTFRREVPTLEEERHVDQPDHHRHFHQRADDRGEGHTGVDAEDGHGHGDGQLEVVARRRERQAWSSSSSPRRACRPIQNDTRNITTK